MKKLFSIFAMLLLAVSCEQLGEEQKAEQPIFPEGVAAVVAPGSEFTVTFEANLDWEVSVPQSAAAYYYIKDGENRIYTARGQKGQHSITVGVESIELFDLEPVCELTMTMASESQVIATLTMSKIERELKIYPVLIEDDTFGYATSGDEIYAYLTTEATEEGVTMIWPYEMSLFSTRVKVVSNFDWIVDGTPEWIVPVSGGSAGVTELWIKGDENNYPMSSMSTVLNFVDATATDKVAGSLKVTIPAATEIFTVEGFAESAQFNSDGQLFNSMVGEYVDGSLNGTVTAVNGSKVVAIEVVESVGIYVLNVDPLWLTVDYAEWDSSSTAVIQPRTLSISAAANDGVARRAHIFVLPADKNDVNVEMMVVNGQVSEEYAQYLATVVEQAGVSGALEIVDQQVMESTGNAITELDSTHWIYSFFDGVAEGYDLLYTSAWAHEDWYLNVKRPYTEIKCHTFDESGNFVEISGSKAWITTTIFGSENQSVRIQMDTTKPTAAAAQNFNTNDYEGVVSFADAEGVFAIVFCRYNENAVVGGNDVDFYYPDYATSYDGSSLVELTSGELYTKYASYGERVMHLTYTSKTPTMSMLKGIPYTWDVSYHNPEDEQWLKYEAGEEFQTVSMKSNGNGKTGALIFGEGKLVLVCTLNIAQ